MFFHGYYAIWLVVNNKTFYVTWCAMPKFQDQHHYYGILCITLFDFWERYIGWLLFTFKKSPHWRIAIIRLLSCMLFFQICWMQLWYVCINTKSILNIILNNIPNSSILKSLQCSIFYWQHLNNHVAIIPCKNWSVCIKTRILNVQERLI